MSDQVVKSKKRPHYTSLDNTLELAALVCDAPMALLLVEEGDLFTLSQSYGFYYEDEHISIPKRILPLHVLYESEDTLPSPELTALPLIHAYPSARIIAAKRLIGSHNTLHGLLAILDDKPRQLQKHQRLALRSVAQQIEYISDLEYQAQIAQIKLTTSSRSDSILNSILKHAPLATFTLDKNCFIDSLNSEFTNILGYSPSDLIGKSLALSFLDPSYFSQRAASMSARYGENIEGSEVFLRPVRTSPAHKSEWLASCKDGNQKYIELTIAPLDADLRGQTGYLCCITDLTFLKDLVAQKEGRARSEVQLKEIHHRVKNNMQIISSLLSIHATKLTDVEQREVFTECKEKISCMSLIHNQLYASGTYNDLDYAHHLKQLVATLFGAYLDNDKRVDLDLDVEPIRVPVDTSFVLSLIASELIINSLKHAFKNRSLGTLTVKFFCHGCTNHLVVSDDGVGMDLSTEQKHGVGVKLVHSLVTQIDGTMRQVSSRGMFTEITWQH